MGEARVVMSWQALTLLEARVQSCDTESAAAAAAAGSKASDKEHCYTLDGCRLTAGLWFCTTIHECGTLWLNVQMHDRVPACIAASCQYQSTVLSEVVLCEVTGVHTSLTCCGARCTPTQYVPMTRLLI